MITREKLIETGELVKDLILVFGGSPSTAFRCAALFVEGLEYENRKSQEANAD